VKVAVGTDLASDWREGQLVAGLPLTSSSPASASNPIRCLPLKAQSPHRKILVLP
jgi:hypothetical protein